MDVLVVGAGGHGCVLAEALLAGSGSVRVTGFLDDNPGRTGEQVMGIPILGTTAALSAIPHDAVCLGIGDNAARARLYRSLVSGGERVISATHPQVTISPSAALGNGAAVLAGAVIGTQAWLGENVIVNTSASVDHHCVIEAHAHLAPGVRLAGGCRVGAGALVGIGTVAIPARRIGAGTIVGAGSVVVADLPAGVVAYGNPARVVRDLPPTDAFGTTT